MSSKGIKIGEVYNNKLMYIYDEDVSELVYNLIEYGLLREELRNPKIILVVRISVQPFLYNLISSW